MKLPPWALRIALFLCSAFVALEAASYAALTLRLGGGGIDLEPYIRNEIAARFAESVRLPPSQVMIFNPVLGWIRAPSTRGMVGGNLYITDSDGARHLPGASGPRLVSTYGDSFTEGLEVDGDKTWPARLAYDLGITVQNYGVSGFGPDQALLYLEENLKRGRGTPIVVLAFIPENLNRLVNAFRPFYTYPEIDFPLFKPIFFEASGGRFETLYFTPPEPTPDAVLLAARKAGDFDYWFHAAQTISESERENARFPFFPALLSALRTTEQSNPAGLPVLPAAPGRAVRVMRYILDRFAADGKAHQFIPVVAAIPGNRADFEQGIANLDEIFGGAPEEVVGIDVSRRIRRSPTDDYRQMFGQTHYSEKANAEIARALAEALRPHVDSVRSRGTPP